MATMSPSSSKRLKFQAPRPRPAMEEEQSQQQSGSVNGSDRSRCGICFSDNVKGIRGNINCCDHYFCFVCIMEWAKVESRCPLCKRRFTVIRRPPRDGVFATDRIVNVPIRDQAYCLFGNTTVVPSDPYAHAKCSVCNGVADESLLLLCDLCDSASHTYCVGLGATVPEGDWFCSDCSLSRTEHDHVQVDDDHDTPNVNVKHEQISATEICNAVKNPNLIPIEHSAPANNNGEASDHPSLCSIGQPIFRNKVTEPDEEETQSHARTLRRCRSVHGYIRSLRENWHALQSGSLSFPSSSVADGSNSRNTSGCSLGLQHSSSSKHDQKLDASKAWKMMDRAKSKQLGQNFSKNYNLESERHSNGFSIKKGPARRCYSEACKPSIVRNGSACFSTKIGGLPDVSNSRNRQPELGASSSFSSSEMLAVNGKIESMEGCGHGVKRQPNDAKSEIQSLVKINLKLLGKRKLLGDDCFKKVARLATHSILAACHLGDHMLLGSVPQPWTICCHSEQTRQLRSSPMPNACLQCFYVFVKDVVNTILCENILDAKLVLHHVLLSSRNSTPNH